MPTAKNPGGGQQSLSLNAFRPAAGGGGPVAAMITQQMESQKKFDKLLQTIEKLQQQNAETVAQAGQAGAGAATQVANQVAQGMERAKQEDQRETERAEDKAFARESQELNAELQKEAAEEAAAMGQSIQAHQTNMMMTAEAFKNKKNSTNQAIAALAVLVEQRREAGHFDSAEGRKKYAKHQHLLDMMRANSDDHFSDKNLAAAFREHNNNLQDMIASGNPNMDLANLQVDPLRSPLPDVEDRGGTIAEPGSISPDKMFELKTMGGYPKNGVVFNEEENYGLPAGNSPRIDDADAFLAALSIDQHLKFVNDKSIRRELIRGEQAIVVKALDLLQPLYEAHTNFNQLFNPMAPQAIENALDALLASPDPNKFNDIGRWLTSRAVQELFDGTNQGERMAVVAMEIFDGKREPSTKEECFIAMALESAVYNIKEHVQSESMSFDEKGGGMASGLVAEMVDRLGEEDAMRALGVDPNTTAPLVRALDVMQNHLGTFSSYANQLHRGLWNGSAIEDFRRDLKTNTILADIFAYQDTIEEDGTRTRLMKITGQNELMQGVEATIVGMTPEEAQEQAGTDRLDLEESFSLLAGMVEIAGGIGPDALRGVATLASAGTENNDSPNLPAYLELTRRERDRGPFGKGIIDRIGHRAKSQAEAKKRAQEKAPPIGESYEAGGVPEVVQKQLPALFGLTKRGIRAAGTFTADSAIKTGKAMQQAAGGRPAADAYQRGINAFSGKVPPMSQEEHRRTHNLSPEEMRQIGQYEEDE
jgi:hypothetical protein